MSAVAAPIPADVLEMARDLARNAVLVRMKPGWLNEAAEPIARAIMEGGAKEEERIREDEREADMRELGILSEYDDFARQCGVASTARTKRLTTLRSRLRCGEEEASQ